MPGNKVSPSQPENNIDQVQGSPSDQAGEQPANAESTVKRDTTQLIIQDINAKGCLCNEESDEKNMCQCGKNQENNGSNVEKQENKSDEERTNYFGEIAFDSNHTAKHILVHSKTTKPETVLNLMKDQWKLEIPALLISVHGSMKSFKTCQTSLMKAVHGTGSWIITDGKHEYVNTDETANQQPIIIGISQWGTIHNKHQMDNHQGSNPANYPIDKSSLDPNHSHFVLIDDGHQYGSNTEINFRDELESAIAKTESVPLVLIVLEWDEKIKTTVQNALTRKIPVVIVTSSDGASKIPEHISKNEFSHICEWNSGSGDLDIGLAIHKALSTGTTNNVWDNMTNVMCQLKLAFAWNRIDIAKDIISPETTRHMVQSLDDFMMTAILMDRMEFVELILKNGFDLKTFLTQKRHIKIPATGSFKEILTKMRTKSEQKDSEGKDKYEKMINLEEVVKDLVQYLYGDSGLQFTRYLQDDRSEQPDDYRYLDLLIFSVLNHCQNVAKCFWRHGKDAIAAALFADSILYAMSHQTDDKNFKDNCEEHRREFTNLAIGVLKECHKDDVNKTKDLLVQQSQWCETSCLLIAVNAKNKPFLTEPAFDDVYKKIWMGQLDKDYVSLKLLFCIFFPPLILICISCKDDEQAQVHPMREQTELNPRQQPTKQATTTSNNSKTTQETNCCRSICQRIKSFYNAPVIIFFHHVIFYIMFLGLYSYILICKFDRYLSWEEIVLCVWVFTIFIQEVIQVCSTPSKDWSSRLSKYIKDGWNIFDIITLIMFLFGMFLRIVDHPQVAEFAHIVLGVNMITFYLRLLHIFYAHHELGPKIVMIMEMVKDLVLFIMILLIFIAAYGFASHAILYPHTEPSLATLTEIFRRPYWNIYGELMLDKIEGSVDCTNDPALYNSGSYSRCPTESGKYFVPLLMVVYMLMCNILLLNLLIAMFSFTFERVQNNSQFYWRNQQYSLINEYANRSFLAPPLSIFVHIWWLIRHISCCKRRCCEVKADEGNPFLKRRQDCKDLREWKNKMAQTFYKEELEHNSNHVCEAVSPNLEKRMDNIEKQLNWLVTTMKKSRR